MVKTTIYLPSALKERLERLADSSGRSEASLIRDAVEAFVAARPPRPRIPLVDAGEVEPILDWDTALDGFGED